MTTFNPNHLASKSDRQLTALFQEASKGLTTASADLAAAQSVVALISSEIARRIPAIIAD